ncbi:hypothetical protein Patl1_19042 [Pistacia atlantica]|uniref:Uncharacterized protein n=1 Tax=Pistacia atlantica TaxID=434234 RepID=A0ACC1BZL9_9ROSI|nr:hypothetical protein Patl1_19042 [Pistacia atlantica]
MDARRGAGPRAVPKVRQVGFFTPNPNPNRPSPPSRNRSVPPDCNSPKLADSPASGNSLSPVMIPPPRHLSENLAHLRTTAAVPVPDSRRIAHDQIAVAGSYNPSDSVLCETFSPNFSEDNSDASTTLAWFSRSGSGKLAAASSSLPSGGFDLTAVKLGKFTGLEDKKQSQVPALQKKLEGLLWKVQNEVPSSSKPNKAKTTKAERRALQESQRAVKAAAKGEGNKPAAASWGAAPAKPQKQPSQPSQKKDDPPVPSSIAASDRKGTDRQPEKERKKDVPAPRMQFDDKHRVEKAKKRALVNQTEARNRVELFRHLPQYEHGTQLPDLESKFFQLDPMHPAVYKVGLQYLAGDISGGNARCIAMLRAFQEAIKDYTTPSEKTLVRDLAAKISSYVSFLIECRPLSMSMGNAIRFLKSHIAKLPLTLLESEAKASLYNDIDRFINEKIILADKVIVRHAATKVRDGDVLLTYGSSCVVEMILLYAHELGNQFRVVVVDSRPKLEGQALLRLGLHVSLWLLTHSKFQFLICCEAYKFHERVQLDSICSNELGDPNAIAKVPGRIDLDTGTNPSHKCACHCSRVSKGAFVDIVNIHHVKIIGYKSKIRAASNCLRGIAFAFMGE